MVSGRTGICSELLPVVQEGLSPTIPCPLILAFLQQNVHWVFMWTSGYPSYLFLDGYGQSLLINTNSGGA